jgi:DNA-binding transcriptional MerR regulator
MKIFKYFILFICFLFPTLSYAVSYKLDNGKIYNGVQETCKGYLGTTYTFDCSITSETKTHAYFKFCYTDPRYQTCGNFTASIVIEEFKCPETGTPQTVFFAKDGLTPTRVCTGPVNGQYCSYSNSNPQVYPYAVRNMVILRSDSDKPVSTCTDTFSGSKCDPKDPYGECYQPPDDKCVRASNGSILCPDDAPPPKVESGCQGGATYCKRPPSGCGSDYVSGTLNNQAVCVKKGGDSTGGSNTGSNNGSTDTTQNSDGSTTSVNKDANGNPTQTTVTNKDGSSSTTNINKDGSSNTVNRDPQGNVTGTSSGNTSSSSNGNGTTITINNNDGSTTIITSDKTNNQTQTSHTPPGGTGQPNTTGGTTIIQKNEVDLSGVIAAINAVVDKLKWLKEELGYSIAEIGKKIDGTNEKLDNLNNKTNATNQKLDESNQNLKDIKNVLDEIKNKPDSSNPSSSPIGDDKETDLSGIEERLDKIVDSTSSIDDFLKEKHDLPEDEKPTIEEHKVEEYEKSYVSWSSACPPDVQVPISLMGQSSTLVLKWSPWCQLLAKLRWAIIACAFFSAAYIILGMRG